MDEERISQRILYVMVALIAVVFMAFYLFGFNEPLASDPAFNAPLLTDVLIGFMWFLLVVAVVAAIEAAAVAVITAVLTNSFFISFSSFFLTFLTTSQHILYTKCRYKYIVFFAVYL